MNHASGFLGLVQECMPRIKEISAEEVAAKMYGAAASRPPSHERGAMREPAGSQRAHFIIIDVREDTEWAAGHATGAVHIGRGVIERDIECAVPDKNTPLVLYCGGGYRSALAADSLQKMGYAHVYSMAGGWRAWCERGFPRQ